MADGIGTWHGDLMHIGTGVPDPIGVAGFASFFGQSGDWYRGRDDDPYSACIVVCDRPSASDPFSGGLPASGERADEEHAVSAAMSALLGMFSLFDSEERLSDRVSLWCSSRIRKIVKHAHGAKWRRLLEMAVQSGIPAVLADCADGGTVSARAVCFAPMRASEQPKELRNLQVSGFELEHAGPPSSTPWEPEVSYMRRGSHAVAENAHEGRHWLDIVVNAGIPMSTGKAVAQAGHAVQVSLGKLGEQKVLLWGADGFPVSFARGDISVDEIGRHPLASINDAGFTEVKPGSNTAVSYFRIPPAA